MSVLGDPRGDVDSRGRSPSSSSRSLSRLEVPVNLLERWASLNYWQVPAFPMALVVTGSIWGLYTRAETDRTWVSFTCAFSLILGNKQILLCSPLFLLSLMHFRQKLPSCQGSASWALGGLEDGKPLGGYGARAGPSTSRCPPQGLGAAEAPRWDLTLLPGLMGPLSLSFPLCTRGQPVVSGPLGLAAAPHLLTRCPSVLGVR